MRNIDFLAQLAHGIATHFGNDCEVVIHDLKKNDIDSSIVYIENGQISKRKLGDGPSEIVLKTLQKDPSQIQDQLCYLTKTEAGRILKSSTLFVRDDDDTIRYIFAINYDITNLLSIENTLKSLIDVPAAIEKSPHIITNNVNNLLDALIDQSINGKPVALMTKDEKIAAIKYLNDAGAFLITKSGDKVSNFFGISKFTLYSYIDAGNKS